MNRPHIPLRLTIDGEALRSNWRWLAQRGGSAACGAAVKADAYGIGAVEAVATLHEAGCRDFFVTTWAEAQTILPVIGDASLSLLHGPTPQDISAIHAAPVKPVLNTPEQVRIWRDHGEGRPCDLMIDTGINRLGLSLRSLPEIPLDGLNIDVLMSHLACGDEDVEMNERQRRLFVEAAATVKAKRLSLSNSAGICLGPDYAFDLTRPGLALYGGVPRREARGNIGQVVRLEAEIVQRRSIKKGDSVGYNATYKADRDQELAILNIGYADGYFRGFSGRGRARIGDLFAPVVGRVSMDLTTICVDIAPYLKPGDWVGLDFDLVSAAAQSGMSQYELLTLLGSRFERCWT